MIFFNNMSFKNMVVGVIYSYFNILISSYIAFCGFPVLLVLSVFTALRNYFLIVFLQVIFVINLSYSFTSSYGYICCASVVFQLLYLSFLSTVISVILSSTDIMYRFNVTSLGLIPVWRYLIDYSVFFKIIYFCAFASLL